jgi:DNA (cytosine-5)-methyltransferase 1
MKVVSLFCGAGGLDLGLINAGHKVVWATDIDQHAIDSYKFNIGKHAHVGDIRNIDAIEIPDCDLVVGGFPCQGFSVANTGRFAEDKRNQLYLELLRVIREKSPSFFLAENVKGLLSLNQGEVFKIILKDFEQLGYRVEYKVLNAADYGIPQKRQRLIIVGVRNDLSYNFEFPAATHAPIDKCKALGLKPWVSIGQALAHIPEPEDAPHILNHTYSKYKLRFNGYIGHRRIDPDQPAPTVTARGDNKGGVVVLHHPKNHRRMSVRELASTQTFPLDYSFQCAQSVAYRLIGNAVPPDLGKVIGDCFPIKPPRKTKIK